MFEEAATCVFLATSVTKLFVKAHQVMCGCRYVCEKVNKWQCLCIPPPLVGEEQQAAGSSDRADQLQNNNFSAAGGAKLLGLDPPTCPVVCCCCWTQSGSHRLLLQGQTRLQWLQPKIGLGRRPLRAPKMLPLFVCLFVCALLPSF